MSETEALFSVLRQSSDPACASAIEEAVRDALDRDLCRVNPLSFAAKRGLDEERTIAAFLHASRLGIFELSWNVSTACHVRNPPGHETVHATRRLTTN